MWRSPVAVAAGSLPAPAPRLPDPSSARPARRGCDHGTRGGDRGGMSDERGEGVRLESARGHAAVQRGGDPVPGSELHHPRGAGQDG